MTKPLPFIWDHRKMPELRVQKTEPIEMAEMSEIPEFVSFYYHYLPTGTTDAVLGYQYQLQEG